MQFYKAKTSKEYSRCHTRQIDYTNAHFGRTTGSRKQARAVRPNAQTKQEKGPMKNGVGKNDKGKNSTGENGIGKNGKRKIGTSKNGTGKSGEVCKYGTSKIAAGRMTKEKLQR